MSNDGLKGLAGGEATEDAALINCNATDKKVCTQARRLGEFDEARGRLISVIARDGLAVAHFPWGSVLLPGEMQEELEALEGREIACLRLDGRYHLRAVE